MTFQLSQNVHPNLENRAGSETAFLTAYSFSLSFADSSSSLQSLNGGLPLHSGLGLFSLCLHSQGGIASPPGLNIICVLLTPHISPSQTPPLRWAQWPKWIPGSLTGLSTSTCPNWASDLLPQPCSTPVLPILLKGNFILSAAQAHTFRTTLDLTPSRHTSDASAVGWLYLPSIPRLNSHHHVSIIPVSASIILFAL